MRDRPCRAALLVLVAAWMSSGTASFASTPPPIWQGVRSVAVQCVVQRLPFRHDAALGSALCARVAQLAARGATLPVTVVAIGDPSLSAPGTVALLVHGSVEPVRSGPVLAFSVRPMRASADQSAVLFAAAPRAVALPDTGLTSPALDAALIAALSETLPWQAQPLEPPALPAPN